MDIDRLFVAVYDDLYRRSHVQEHGANAEYETLKIAALLRQLLLDEDPLTHKINRTYRYPLRFRVNNTDSYKSVILQDKPLMWAEQDGLDPETSSRQWPVLELNRDKFLAHPVMYYTGQEISVRDITLHLAHHEGAVHASEPKTEKDKSLAELERLMLIGGSLQGCGPCLPSGVLCAQHSRP